MDIFQKVENHIVQLFKDNSSSGYYYHNFEHTSQVVYNINKLAKAEGVSDNELELLLLAGWFHDTGYFRNYIAHEDASIELAQEFLGKIGVDNEKIEAISRLISSTKMEHSPENLLEQIMKDSDFSHLSSDQYLEISEHLKNELEATQNILFTDLKWAKENLAFIKDKHEFYTDYAKQNWQPLKQKNIEKIQEVIIRLENEKILRKRNKELLDQKKLDNMEIPERGIDTMFRVTLNNHTRLSQIADSKANILLSVNAILISIALTTLIPKLDSPSNSHLIIPTFIMVFFSVITIVCAIFSTKPKISRGHFTREDVEQKKVNLLFFGNFYKMPFEEYNWAMREMMKDKDYLYDTLIKDLYYLGLVLSQKYKWLTLTYIIFTIGIIVSALSFVIAFKMATW